jgi:hypothetical protein
VVSGIITAQSKPYHTRGMFRPGENFFVELETGNAAVTCLTREYQHCLVEK